MSPRRIEGNAAGGRGFESGTGTGTGTGEAFHLYSVQNFPARKREKKDDCGYWLAASMTDSSSNLSDL